MKKTLALIVATVLLATGTQAQINASNVVSQITTNAAQQTGLDKAINALGLSITNYTLDPYLTYAPSVPKGSSKIGGGILALYNFNQNVGAGIGLDWLGQFSLVSGDLQLGAPFHLSTIVPVFKNVAWLQSVEVVPFALGGVGTPYSGNGHFNGSAMVISDLGGAVKFGHALGGQFDTGLAWGKWTGSGTYANVTRYHAFIGFTKGF